MTIRNLEYLFSPCKVAHIGASKRMGSLGTVLAKNLLNELPSDRLLFVNPKYKEIHKRKCYKSISSLPETPDLAVISTPAKTVPKIIKELGEKGTKAAIVITAGFGEGNEAEGEALKQEMLDAARPYLMRIIGPNCLGVISPEAALNASFAHLPAEKGRLAFVTQSGAIVTAILDWAAPHKIGFSHLVSLGDMSDVDFGDMLDYLANDRSTRAILLYVEAVTEVRKFMSAARAASRMKPVIVVKSGRFAESAKAASSHTGALAGSDAVYDAVFRRAGMLRVNTLEALFDAAEVLAMDFRTKGERLAILTNGGGLGVMATDEAIARGAKLAELSEESMDALNEVLPATWSHGNPIDIIGDAKGERYANALEVLIKDRNIDAILAINCPTAITSSIEAAQVLTKTAKAMHCRNLITSWVGNLGAQAAWNLFAEHQIPSYETPEQAVRAFMYRVDYQNNQKQLSETPASIRQEFSTDEARARQIMRDALDEGREWLSEAEAKAVLAAYSIPVVTTHIAPSPEAAAAIARDLDAPVALKILSPQITHKSDVGGVSLDLLGYSTVKQEAEAMLQRVAQRRPDAELEGFTVQPMVQRPGARELIVGVSEDHQFGPVILFGQGGTAVEVLQDTAISLPPLNMKLSRELMSRTRIIKLLEGYRDRPAADLDELALTLMKISQMVVDLPEMVELDINPLLADEFGVLALDARIRVRACSEDCKGEDRLAIRPYPKALEQDIPLADGRSLLLRPIKPEDEPALKEGFDRYTDEEKRMRFFVPMKTLNHVTAARFTQIDYDREMALVLTEQGIPGTVPTYGTVRLICDPDNERGEYAIIIAGEMTGMGLGLLMMRTIIDYGRTRGLKEIYGDVLRENSTMLGLCRALGFEESFVEDEPSLTRVTLKL